MRLVDADKLEVYSATVPEDCNIESYMEGAGDVLEIIDKMPTIEAIPVEWVKKWIFEHPYFYVTGSTLLGDWQKEQRKEE